MTIELIPDPGVDDPSSRAVSAALMTAGLDGLDPAFRSSAAWRAAGITDALDRAPYVDPVVGSSRRGAAAAEPSAGPRNTRGATRA
jgi:hypothetical protein